MKLQALQDFAHAEDCINVINRKKNEAFEVENEEHGQRLIDAKLAKKTTKKTETKVVEPKETK